MQDRKSKILDDTYIVVQSWMVKQLGLKDKELLVYALVYGFSQDDETWFTGSLQYIADWICVDRKHVYSRYIRPLLDRGLLVRDSDIRNNVEFPKYRAVKPDCVDNPRMVEVLPEWEQSQNGSSAPNMAEGCSQNGDRGAPRMGLNNISENIEKNILLSKDDARHSDKKEFDVERFMKSKDVSIQIARLDEASYGTKWSKSIVDYVEESCNCFGPSHMRIINSFSDDEYLAVFREATHLVDNDLDYSGIKNPKGYMSSVIKKQIEKHRNSNGEKKS